MTSFGAGSGVTVYNAILHNYILEAGNASLENLNEKLVV